MYPVDYGESNLLQTINFNVAIFLYFISELKKSKELNKIATEGCVF